MSLQACHSICLHPPLSNRPNQPSVKAAQQLSPCQIGLGFRLLLAAGCTAHCLVPASRHLSRDLRQDPSMIKLFRRDPDAFMLEAARVRPPVGGMNPYQFREPQEIPLPSAGRTWTARAGGELGPVPLLTCLRACSANRNAEKWSRLCT